ncbi:hypothetical protein L7F22_056228 [Adiantum nelumboides]|nr:hypothetical protein [Adiantum nelumboides]
MEELVLGGSRRSWLCWPPALLGDGGAGAGWIEEELLQLQHGPEALHVDIVRQIKKIKDSYRILGLEKDCLVEEIQKDYVKVSLKVHPDKNKAPGVDEAFKAVFKAKV